MKKQLLSFIILCSVVLFGCAEKKDEPTQETALADTVQEIPFDWNAANVYFLLTDRFNNADPANDVNYGRNQTSGVLRGFEGGDLKGVTAKIKEGYFDDLGINAIWMTPVVEQIHSGTDEGTGYSYPFHGYWTSDWTTLDPNFGTEDDLADLVKTAHEHGIRILLDAVINHTGPVTDSDPVWPEEWVRTSPKCTYESYETAITCTLVENLPDIKTESDAEVELPPQLAEKWKAEGRYEQEMQELDEFFARTGYPRAARFYIMKWLTDYITDYGIDGYRVDTVRHVEEYTWQEFRDQCDFAFAQWKANNPEAVMDDNGFYLVGEVYGYGIGTGRYFDFGDKQVDYFDDMFDALINFDLKNTDTELGYEQLFSRYDSILNSSLAGFGTLSYMTSHDDSSPFDKSREKTYQTATLLQLAPGAAQVYYGDESARSLIIEGTEGDATLRSFMNWEDITDNAETQELMKHWQRLGQFRHDHPAVGAGRHRVISENPYLFSRTYTTDRYSEEVVVGLDLEAGSKTLDVSTVFQNGDQLTDRYSDQQLTVTDGKVVFDSPYDIVLLEKN
ncbi:alpha-amylase family glycosyl hydrolase [Aureitalea marina]|uniref:Alpha-amlyase n=1 Tax=Aureitalea marina TaxID=930804 RepID=A0A2S7KNG2_9FLAO|nr:alpha-amylase family glycosyl hydrolase [Aureitalea marina]PQB04151.1 alpha-amlyase [Aureitalea marina]